MEICRMRILLVSATEMEISPFLLDGLAIDHQVTGVGIAPTIYHLTKRLAENSYDLVIHAGIAGSFSKDLPPGTSVVVKREVFADAGAFENAKLLSLFDLGLANKDSWPYTNGWLENSSPYLQQLSLDQVNAVTVNTVTDEMRMSEAYLSKYSAQIESMEGAAFHYVCLQENVSFLQFRAISNYVGERDKSKWQINLAIQNVNKAFTTFIKGLANRQHT